jgi:hypothetical protein
MYQGWRGSWQFVLPFTVEQGKGAYLFLFYLALGHLARISGSGSQLIFHLFRIASASLMVFSLWFFFGRVFSSQRMRKIAFGLALFGSGMGWLASSFGVFSADFWVAEGYPFLSAYANPHFPLGLAIMLWILAPESPASPGGNGIANRNRIVYIISGFVLAIVMPFGVVIATVILTGLLLWEIFSKLRLSGDESKFINVLKSEFTHSETGQKLSLLLLGGSPVLVYQVWVTRSDPLLATWNSQNITISPPIWELLIAYAPIILVAVPGIYLLLKSGDESKTRILLVWTALGLLLIYVPWSLQRRFISGFMIPLSGLAAITLELIISRKKVVAIGALVLLVLLMVSTNLMIVLGGYQAVNNKAESIFLSEYEYQGLKWLETNSEEDAVILASPEMGLFVPAYTGRRVWYGHPFETPLAEEMESHLQNLFSGGYNDSTRRLLRNSDFLFYGSRERALGELDLSSGYELVFESGDTRIYRIE